MKKAPKAPQTEAPTQVIERVPALPLISEKMQSFLTNTFQKHPGSWRYHMEEHAAEIESQLVSRGLVIRDEFPSKGRVLIRYCGKPQDGAPPALEM